MAYPPRMKYRRFGRTELQMPVISCGGMRYQFKWQDVAPNDVPRENQQNVEAIIRRAMELGIHHIETTRGYNSSEMQLGNIAANNLDVINAEFHRATNDRFDVLL